MFKSFVIFLLVALAGVAGNLLAGYIQQDVWRNIFTPERLLGTVVGLILIGLVLAFLETSHALPWNWRWHRFWYLHELMQDPRLKDWERDFARLEAHKSRRVGAEVLAEGQRQDLVNTLQTVVTDSQPANRRALVLGEPGSGKSTSLARLALDLARNGMLPWRWNRPMPVLARLGTFPGGELLPLLKETMQLEGGNGEALGNGITGLVKKGRVILLLDALDETLGERREQALTEIQKLLESPIYRKVPIVITSRTREDPGGRLAGLQVFEIQDLSDQAVHTFIEVYNKTEFNEAEIWSRLETHKLLEPQTLGRNPFWLKLIL